MKNNITKSHEIPLNKILKPILYIFFSILLEIIQFLFLGFKKNGSIQFLPTYFIFNLSVNLIVAGLIFVWNKKWVQNIFFYVFLAIQVFFNIINSLLYTIFGYVFYFNLLTLLDEGIGAFNFGLIHWPSVFANLAILGVIIASQIVVDKRLNFKISTKKLSSFALSLIVFFSCIAVGTTGYSIQTVTISETDNKYFYQDLVFKNSCLQKFGIYGYLMKDIANLIHYPDLKLDKQLIMNEIKNSEARLNPSATLYDDNLIVIMLESFDWFAIDPYNTPNIYHRLMGEGVVMTDFISNNKTNISEDISLLGYMPLEETLNVKSDQLSVAYSLPNLFKAQGYQTNYFHSYLKTFYGRNTINKNIGFENLYFIEDADIENKNLEFNHWNKETDFFEYFKDKIAPTDQKFMSYYLTVSTHGSYDVNKPNFEEYYDIYDSNLEKSKAWLEEQGFIYPTNKADQQRLRQFKSAAIDTDKMIGLLLDHLENSVNSDGTKLIDNTSIVLFADHNAYFHDLAYKMRGNAPKDYKKIDSFNVPLMIYSKKLEAQKISYFTNTYDIYPTICELYGLPYSKYMSIGYDIFSKDNPYRLYFSQLTGYYTDKIYSSNIFDKILISDVSRKEIEEFETKALEMFTRQQILNQIYRQRWKHNS